MTPWRLARVLFAHEWGHICHWTSEPWKIVNEGCDKWHRNGANELVANAAEFYGGKTQILHHKDPYYRMGFGNGTWKEQCWQVPGDYSEDARDENYEPFTAYMIQHLDAGSSDPYDDGLSLWIQGVECDEIETAKFDFAALDTMLMEQQFDDYFSAQTGDERLQELFRDYVLALWVNSSNIDGEKSVFLPNLPGSSIRDNFHFFHDYEVGGQYCIDDALVYPLYNEVSTTLVEEEGPVYAEDVTEVPPINCNPTSDEEDWYRKELVFETYGFEVLPFVASDAIVNSGKCHDLLVSITLEESCDCKIDDTPATMTWNPNDPEAAEEVLHFWVIGYPDYRTELDTHGNVAVLIDSITVVGPTVNQAVSFTIPCFGTRFQSVVLLASLAEQLASDGETKSQNIPFRYTYMAKLNPLEIVEDSTYPTNTKFLCVDDWVTIPDQVSATILPGTEVWLADPDVVSEDVGFEVTGLLEIGDENGDLTTFIPAGDWDGFTVAVGGSLIVANAEILDIKEIDTNSLMPTFTARVDLRDVEMSFTQTGNGLLLDKAADVWISGSTLNRVPFVKLGDATVLDTKAYMSSNDGSVAFQIGDDASLDNVVIYDAWTAIQVTDGDVSLNDVSAKISQGSGSNLKLGLHIVEDGEVDAKDCTFRGFDRGVAIEDNGKLTLRQAVIEEADLGVYCAGNGVGELGNSQGQPGDPGNSCIGGDPTRVLSRSSVGVLAHYNYWDDASPDSAWFRGNVDWANHQLSCYLGAGGPGFSYGTGGTPFTPDRPAVFPNPFNPSCTIHFALPAGEPSCELAIYDIAGRRVATLFEGAGDGKDHELEWSGEMDSGGRAGSGVYLLSLRIGNQVNNTKLVLVH